MIDDDAIIARYRELSTGRPRPQVDAAILQAAGRHARRPALHPAGVGLAAGLAAVGAMAWWLGTAHGPVPAAPVESAGIAEGRSDALAGRSAPDQAGMNEGRTAGALARAM